MKQTDEKRRMDRLYQQKHRGSKRSYVTEAENLRVLLAWEVGELSEGQAAKYLGLDRVDLRDLRIQGIAGGVAAYSKWKEGKGNTNLDRASGQ